jgi:hypothetical protein
MYLRKTVLVKIVTSLNKDSQKPNFFYMKILKTKIQIIIAIMMIVGLSMFTSCTQEDVISDNLVSDSNKSVSSKIAATNPLSAPSGWVMLYSTTNGKGVCFTKNSNYVVAMNLTAGDIVARPLYDTPTPSVASATTPNPTFPTGDVLYWKTKGTNVFAVSNCSFFAYNTQSQNPLGGSTTLPFVLKRSGSILASGQYLVEEANQRYLVLGKNGPNGFYSEIGDNPTSYTGTTLYQKSTNFYNSNTSNPGNTIIGGLHPLNADKDKTTATGRTFVGIKDCNGDGYKEALYILVSKSLTQQQAYDILRNEFLCDQSIMFDGSGSSQLVCKDTELVKSIDANSSTHLYLRRKFPVALQVVTN